MSNGKGDEDVQGHQALSLGTVDVGSFSQIPISPSSLFLLSGVLSIEPTDRKGARLTYQICLLNAGKVVKTYSSKFVNGFGKVVVIAHFPSNGEGRAAQGFHKPTAKIIEEAGERWAFVVKSSG
jgi:hypothetical protein